MIVNLSTPKSAFSPSDIKTYKWHKLSDATWIDLYNDLYIHLKKFINKNSALPWVSAHEAMDYMNDEFCRVRSKYLKPSWRREGGKPWFDSELRDLKSTIKALRRKIFRIRNSPTRAKDVQCLGRNGVRTPRDILYESTSLFHVQTAVIFFRIQVNNRNHRIRVIQ